MLHPLYCAICAAPAGFISAGVIFPKVVFCPNCAEEIVRFANAIALPNWPDNYNFMRANMPGVNIARQRAIVNAILHQSDVYRYDTDDGTWFDSPAATEEKQSAVITAIKLWQQGKLDIFDETLFDSDNEI